MIQKYIRAIWKYMYIDLFKWRNMKGCNVERMYVKIKLLQFIYKVSIKLKRKKKTHIFSDW